MRRALATSNSLAPTPTPTRLCAVCARKRIATPAATAQAVFSLRPYSTRREAASWRLSPSLQSPRQHIPSRQRWLATSPAPRAPEQSAASDSANPSAASAAASSAPSAPSSNPPAAAHTPLPYYALFPQTLPSGPPPAGPFSIDVRALRREFLQLQAASHPDFHHAAASSSSSSSSQTHSLSRRKAEALSSHINAAYKTLSSPLLRAQYLLAERYGIDLAGDEASSLTGPPDAGLLGDVMAAREVIEEAGSEEELEGVREENDERIRSCLGALERAFEGEHVEGAVRETVRLRYWENIRESIEAWEEGKPVVLQH